MPSSASDCLVSQTRPSESFSTVGTGVKHQSLGGHTAMLLASARPELVAALVLVEAGPAGPNPELPAQIGTWLDTWPTPFRSLAEAENFLGHEGWARGLEKRADSW